MKKISTMKNNRIKSIVASIRIFRIITVPVSLDLETLFLYGCTVKSIKIVIVEVLVNKTDKLKIKKT